MKLAEALILRADCQKRLEQLKQRLLVNAKVQEGEKPPEDPQKLLAELEQVAGELQRLIQRINRTNTASQFQDGTLSDALARRDVLGQLRAVYVDLSQAASVRQDRFTRSEVKFISTLKVPALRKQADEMAKQYRELDAQIQQANWTVELL